jgi:poly(3-hydroxybutyrate) depolymerase
MRFASSIVFVSGTILTVLACSSSDGGAVGQAGPDGGATSSSGGSSGSGPADGGSSGTTSSSGSTDAAADADVEYVKNTTIKMQHESVERSYVLSVPLDYSAAKSYPVYVWLHGDPGDAVSASGRRIDRVTKNEAIVAYPGALAGAWDHTAAEQDNPDTTFIFAMIDDIEASYAIDKSRILLGGWSSGGFMAGLVACRYSGSFRAIAVEAGGAPFDINGGPNPTCDGAAIATLVTHGGQDNTVGPTSGFYAAEYWEEHNGCNGSKAASSTPLCEDYAGCPADKPVRYCFDPNWGHGIFPNAHEIEWAWFKALP